MYDIIGLFKKSKNELEKGGIEQIHEDVATHQCPSCKNYLKKPDLAKNKSVCLVCRYHFRIFARKRIAMLIDKKSFKEHDKEMTSKNPLSFPNYDKKLLSSKQESNENDAVICGTACINGIAVAIFAMESKFMMGSMGVVTGEKITKLFEYATQNKLPVIGCTCSGGARMQEGILSLMQMAKISGAVKKHSDNGNLYITVITDPTTGGVTASFAMEGDIIISEPNALIGFAGKRVIEQTTGKKLPQGFQSAEFMLEHGFIDMIVDRNELQLTLSKLLALHQKQEDCI